MATRVLEATVNTLKQFISIGEFRGLSENDCGGLAAQQLGGELIGKRGRERSVSKAMMNNTRVGSYNSSQLTLETSPAWTESRAARASEAVTFWPWKAWAARISVVEARVSKREAVSNLA